MWMDGVIDQNTPIAVTMEEILDGVGKICVDVGQVRMSDDTKISLTKMLDTY